LKSPEISVLLPFYNSEKTLRRGIKSILEQTLSDFELILIHNNSTDNSLGIALECCAVDSRCKLIDEKQQGIVPALNRGLEVARSKFLARMDADDWSYPDRLQMQVDFLEKNKDYGVVSGAAEYITHKPETDGFKRYVSWSNSILKHHDIYCKQFIESPIIHPTVMWRKEISDNFGSYLVGDFPEDYELWLRWLEKGVKFHKINEPVIKWFDSENRLTRTDDRYSDQAFFKIKSYYLAKWLKVHNPFHPSVVVWGASKISRHRTIMLEEHGINISAYIDISKKRRLDKKIMYFKDIPSSREIFVLVYLKEETMRANTIKYLEDMGFKEGSNFLLVS